MRVMRISREELVLYGLETLIHERGNRPPFNREDLANALDISIKTLNEYLTRLKKVGLIKKQQKKFVGDLDSIITITGEGKERLESINRSIDKLVMTPEHHNIPSIIKVRSILERIRDPLEKLFFLTLYSYRKEFDLIMFLDALKISMADSNLVNIFSDMDLERDDSSRIPFIITFSKTSFHGDFEKKILEKDGWSLKDVNALLIIAESNQKQGKLKDAISLYEFILSGTRSITQNQWFIARMGMVQVYRKMGEFDNALTYLEETEKNTRNKTFLAFSKQLKALILTIDGEFEEAGVLFDSAIRSFKTFGLPLMLSICYNNRGTLNYRNGRIEDAREDWRRARRYAREAGSDYCESAILTNLADLVAKDGKFELSFKYLDRAENIVEKIGDYENLAGIEYNRSLVYIIMKEKEKAILHFRRSMKVAYPLPSPKEKEEWKTYLINYSNENQCPIKEIEI